MAIIKYLDVPQSNKQLARKEQTGKFIDGIAPNWGVNTKNPPNAWKLLKFFVYLQQGKQARQNRIT